MFYYFESQSLLSTELNTGISAKNKILINNFKSQQSFQINTRINARKIKTMPSIDLSDPIFFMYTLMRYAA